MLPKVNPNPGVWGSRKKEGQIRMDEPFLCRKTSSREKCTFLLMGTPPAFQHLSLETIPDVLLLDMLVQSHIKPGGKGRVTS